MTSGAEISFDAVQVWLAKSAEWLEADHPRDANGRFASVDAQIEAGRRAINRALRDKADVLSAMHRKGIGPIDFRWGNKSGGIAHIVDKRGEAAARRLPDVIARGQVEADTRRAGSRARVNIDHDGFRVVLSPDYHGEPGHWVVTGFTREVAKSAPDASADPHMNRTGLRTASLSSLPTMGAGVASALHERGKMAMANASIAKDMTVSDVHVPGAMGGRARTFKAIISSMAETARHTVVKRALQPHTADTAKTPFLYDVNALGSLRPDQVPRFFGALTDADKLPTADVDLASLHAMQDRVDPKKVAEIGASDGTTKRPVVVRHDGKNYIANGHHRLAAAWLAGDDKAQVAFKDLEPVSDALKAAPRDARSDNFRVAKIDDSLGLVFGWAIVCKVAGEDYYDLNVDHAGEHAGQRVPEHIPEDTMLKAAGDFMHTARPGNEMHDGPDTGTFTFAFPLTTDIAKAMGIVTEKTGLMVAYRPTPAVLAKFKSGEYRGFSIEGRRLAYEEHTA